jgi:hydrogenase maturation protease
MVADVVIGLGNPVLTDDGVGLAVVRRLRTIAGLRAVALVELYCGGLALMEGMVGYDRVFLVDAMTTGATPGTIRELTFEQVAVTHNAYSSHNGSLATAFELGRLCGARLPRQIRVWGVEAQDVHTFGEQLTLPVRAAVPIVASAILQHLLPRAGGAV